MVWLNREERVELDQLRDLLRPGDGFVDVGANIGLWSLRAGALVGDAGRVWAVEPNPAVYERLITHLHDNGLGDVVLPFECAAGEFEAVGVLESSEGHNVATVSMTVAGPDREQRVVIRSLDKIVDLSVPIAGVKIDIEGGELAALKGARQLLTTWRPWLCIEFNTTLLPSVRLGEWGVHQFLVGQGYTDRPTVLGDPRQPVVDASWTIEGYCNLLYRFEPLS